MAVDPQMMEQMMAQLGQSQAPPMDPRQAVPLDPSQGEPDQGQADPAMMEQMMAQLGGGQQPAQGVPNGDWLMTAINSVHDGMVQEQDPNQVSLLGSILNQLTTFQAKAAGKGGNAQGG